MITGDQNLIMCDQNGFSEAKDFKFILNQLISDR